MNDAVSKGEFAAIIGVTPGRISQYLAQGKITSAALVGHGRNAKIIVERARADLRLTLDISQRLGNGIDTRLDTDDDMPLMDRRRFSDPEPDELRKPSIDHVLKQEKLEQTRRATRNAAIADAQTAGQLTTVATAREEMIRMASSMLLTFEGSLTDFAAAIASTFKLPQRDVLHLLRGEFRKVRDKASKAAKLDADNLPDAVEAVIEAEEIETIN